MARATTDRLEAVADRIFGVAFAFPLLLLAAFVVGALAGHANAEEAIGTDRTLAACGRDLRSDLDAETTARIETEVKDVAGGKGLFWRIGKEGIEPSFLIGTIHLDDPRVRAIPSAVGEAVDGADRTVLELAEIADPEAMAAGMFAFPDFITLPQGRTLRSLLSDEQYETVSRGLAERGIPMSTMEQLQPWFIGAALSVPDCRSMSLDPTGGGLDGAIARRAIENGQEVIGLETLSEQLGTLSSLPLETQVEQLVASAELLDDVNDMMETMIGIYRDEQIGALLPTLKALYPDAEAMVGGSESFAAFETALLDERNERMVERLEPLLEQGRTFVGVGALHLIGETGIVDALRRKGWSVDRIDRGALE